jgi:hypothetical protein
LYVASKTLFSSFDFQNKFDIVLNNSLLKTGLQREGAQEYVYIYTRLRLKSTTAHSIDTNPMVAISLLAAPLIYQYSMIIHSTSHFNPAYIGRPFRGPTHQSNNPFDPILDMIVGFDTKLYISWVELTLENQLVSE